MSELMHGDVISFIIHAIGWYTRTQTRLFFAPQTRPGMPRTSCRFNDYMMRDTTGIFTVKTHLLQQTRHIGSKGIGIRIKLASPLTQFVLIQGRTGFEAVIPDIVRTQVPSQTLTDDRCYLLYLLRTDQRPKQTIQLSGRYLYPLLKITLNTRRGRRTIGIGSKIRMRDIQDLLITRVGFSL